MKAFDQQQNEQRNNKSTKASEAIHLRALKFHANKDTENAAKFYLKAIKAGSRNPSTFSNLGVLHSESGRKKEAIRLYKLAISINPEHSISHFNLGDVYLALNEIELALTHTLKSIKIDSNNANAFMNLGLIYEAYGMLEKAIECLLKSIELNSENPTTYQNLGSIYQSNGNLDQALKVSLKAIQLNSKNPFAYQNLGSIYKQQGKYNEALKATIKSLEIQSNNSQALFNLGNIYAAIGDLNKSRSSFLRAFQVEQTTQMASKAYLFFSDIHRTTNELNEEIKKYSQNLKEIFKPDSKINQGKEFIDLSLLMLTYLNLENDKSFMENIANITRNRLQVKTKENTIQSNTNSRNTIGFYFDNPDSNHVICRHYLNLVKACKSSGFQITLIKGPVAQGQNDTQLKKLSAHTVQLQNDIKQSVCRLKSLELSAIVYTEMHSSPTPYCLAHNRIAPVQILLPGNSLTTGLDTIDYYISSDLTEPIDGAKNYSEELIKLKGLPTSLSIDEDECKIIASKLRSRPKLDLPLNNKLIGLLHNPIKYHPDMDSLLERIAKDNPTVKFIVTKGNNNLQTQRLVERWRDNAPNALSQCHFLDRMKKIDYLITMRELDLLLDPIYRGCGTTAFDALSQGVPIVTLPGNHSRSRLVSGIYKAMSLCNPPIASTSEEYIEWCTKLVNDKNMNKNLKNTIKESYTKFLNKNISATEELVHFLQKVIKKAY